MKLLITMSKKYYPPSATHKSVPLPELLKNHRLKSPRPVTGCRSAMCPSSMRRLAQNDSGAVCIPDTHAYFSTRRAAA